MHSGCFDGRVGGFAGGFDRKFGFDRRGVFDRRRKCCDWMLICRDRGFFLDARLLDCRYIPNCPGVRRGCCC